MKVSLERTLQATGFLIGDVPAPGLRLQPDGFDRVDLSPDAVWRDRSRLEVIFKCVEEEPPGKVVASWHRDVLESGCGAAALGRVAGLHSAVQRIRTTDRGSDR